MHTGSGTLCIQFIIFTTDRAICWDQRGAMPGAVVGGEGVDRPSSRASRMGVFDCYSVS